MREAPLLEQLNCACQSPILICRAYASRRRRTGCRRFAHVAASESCSSRGMAVYCPFWVVDVEHRRAMAATCAGGPSPRSSGGTEHWNARQRVRRRRLIAFCTVGAPGLIARWQSLATIRACSRLRVMAITFGSDPAKRSAQEAKGAPGSAAQRCRPPDRAASRAPPFTGSTASVCTGWAYHHSHTIITTPLANVNKGQLR